MCERETQLYTARDLRAPWYRLHSKKIGDTVRIDVAAPGTGFVEYRVTRIDESGMWGAVVRSTVRELQPWEVR